MRRHEDIDVTIQDSQLCPLAVYNVRVYIPGKVLCKTLILKCGDIFHMWILDLFNH